MTASPHDFTLDAFIGGSGGGDGPELRATTPHRRTLVVVGHLPVMSGLWISQFADREARDGGAVCLVRLEHDAVQLELFRAGGRRPSVSPQASITEAVRAIAPTASRWMIVPRGAGTPAIPAGVTDIVVLTGADDVAIVAAYEIVRDHHAQIGGREGTPLPISVAVLGADEEAFANASSRLRAAAQRFLGCDLTVVGGLQRVAPVDSTFRGTFNAPAPTLDEIDAMIDSAQRAAAMGRPMQFTTASLRPGAHAASASPSGMRERFAPNGARRAPRTGQPASEAPIPITAALTPTPPASASAASVRRRPAGVSRPNEDEALRPASRRRAFDMPEDVQPTAEELHALRAEIARTSAEAHAYRRAAAAAAPAMTADVSTTPDERSVRRVASLEPAPAMIVRAAVVVDDAPETLSSRFLDLSGDLRRFRFAAPDATEISLAVDGDGRMHIVGRGSDLAAIGSVRKWLRENDAMIRAVEPGYTSREAPLVDIVFTSLAEARPMDGVRRHIVQTIEMGGRRGLLAQALDA